MKIFRPPGEPPVRHDDVVAQGCADWDRRVSDAIAGRTSWKRCVYACLGIIAVSVSGNIWLAGQSKVQVIHVVHDSIGGVIAVSVSSDPQGDPTQAMLKAALENWIVDVRTIYIDVNALRRSIQAAYDLLEGRSRAAGALTAFYTAQDPVKRAETETVSLENVVAVPPTSSDIGPDGLQTWRVTWIEHITSRDGQTETRQAWAGNITFKLKQPTTVAEASRDPDGIRIEAFSWTGGAALMRLRLALLASCIASPAFAQPVPAIDATAAAAATASAAVTAPHQQIATVSQGNLQGTVQGQGGVPLHMPPPIDPVSPDKPLNAKERAGVAVARRWINRFQAPHLDEDGVVHFTAGRGQVAVVTAIDHLTDIALAPGEIIAPPLHVGDDTAWKIHTAASGSGRRTISHVLVKPIDASLSTNLVIETNKRTISISLTSRRADYMPLVSLDIADDPDTGQGAAMILAANQTTAAASPCDQQPVITPDQFRIVGDNVPWRPVQVYVVSTPVGMKTCVEFPSDIGSQGLPAMLALADDGGWFSAPTKQMINVRYVRRRFVADELLSRFILVDGVGSDQRSVTVTRKKS